MAQRLFRTFLLVMLTIALLGPSPSRADDKELRPTIAFSSTRDPHQGVLLPFGAAEIYLMSPPDGANPSCTVVGSCDPRRLTDDNFGDGFAKISPDGKRIVFDSTRLRKSGEPNNTSHLFVMNTDGSDQTFLTRGNNASWSPDGKQVVFHASASGTGLPIRGDPGSATTDSDIFVLNVDDCLKDVERKPEVDCQDENGPIKRNLTNTPDAIEDDAHWSPESQAEQKIAFTSHASDDNPDNSITAEIYVMNPDGTHQTRLTFNTHEERAPAWSPDGSQIVFMCRPEQLNVDRLFEICVMNANGGNRRQLTHDGLTSPGMLHATASWSPDGEMIVFDKVPGGAGSREMWTMPPVVDATQTQLTETVGAGINGYSNYGVARITGQGDGQVAAGSTERSAETVQAPAVDDGTGKDRPADHGKQAKDQKDTTRARRTTRVRRTRRKQGSEGPEGQQAEGRRRQAPAVTKRGRNHVGGTNHEAPGRPSRDHPGAPRRSSRGDCPTSGCRHAGAVVGGCDRVAPRAGSPDAGAARAGSVPCRASGADAGGTSRASPADPGRAKAEDPIERVCGHALILQRHMP